MRLEEVWGRRGMAIADGGWRRKTKEDEERRERRESGGFHRHIRDFAVDLWGWRNGEGDRHLFLGESGAGDKFEAAKTNDLNEYDRKKRGNEYTRAEGAGACHRHGFDFD